MYINFVFTEPLDNWKDIDEYNDDNRLLQVKEELDGKDDDQFYSTVSTYCYKHYFSHVTCALGCFRLTGFCT